MKYSDDLYQLIKSLSKSEKRYFRLFASRYSGEKKYMLLFEAIERQEGYDEEAVRTEFEGESIARHLHVAKNYLYKLILRSLRAYYAESSTQIRLRETVTDIEILYERGMFKQARKVWRGALKWAERLDDPHLKLSVIKLRHQLSGKDTEKIEHLDDIQNARRSALKEMEELFEYEYLVEKLGNICTRNPSRGPAEYAQLDEVMESPLLTEEPQDAPFRIREYYLWAWATYHYGRNDRRTALQYMRRLQELCGENSDFMRERPTEYLGIVTNILTLLSHLGRDDDFVRELGGLERTFNSLLTDTLVNTRVTYLYQLAIYWNKLLFHIDSGNFDCSLTLATEVDRFFEEYPDYTINGDMPRMIYLLAYSNFAVGRRREALHYLNRILNGPEPRKGRSGYYAGRLLEIIVHLELSNTELVASRVRSLRNYLIGKEWFGGYEKEALAFFEAAAAGRETPEMRERLRGAFEGFDLTLSKHRIFFYMDFVAWIESRTSGKAFAEVVRDRYRRKHHMNSNGTSNGTHASMEAVEKSQPKRLSRI